MRTLVVVGIALFVLSGCIVERTYTPPPPPTPQPIYATCAGSAACVSGATCYDITYESSTGSVCSNGCASDAECATGSTGARGGCYDLGGGTYLCYERCSSDADCPGGFACLSTSAGDAICLPGAPAPPPPENYANCATIDDCNSLADDCFFITFEGFTAGMCSNTCASDSDCPTTATAEAGACYDVMGSGVYLCYERCFTDGDCAPGFRCVTTAGGASGDAICLP